jgi:hypothetical protein
MHPCTRCREQDFSEAAIRIPRVEPFSSSGPGARAGQLFSRPCRNGRRQQASRARGQAEYLQAPPGTDLRQGAARRDRRRTDQSAPRVAARAEAVEEAHQQHPRRSQRALRYADDVDLIRAPRKIGLFRAERPEIECWELDEYARILAAARNEGAVVYAAACTITVKQQLRRGIVGTLLVDSRIAEIQSGSCVQPTKVSSLWLDRILAQDTMDSPSPVPLPTGLVVVMIMRRQSPTQSDRHACDYA